MSTGKPLYFTADFTFFHPGSSFFVFLLFLAFLYRPVYSHPRYFFFPDIKKLPAIFSMADSFFTEPHSPAYFFCRQRRTERIFLNFRVYHVPYPARMCRGTGSGKLFHHKDDKIFLRCNGHIRTKPAIPALFSAASQCGRMLRFNEISHKISISVTGQSVPAFHSLTLLFRDRSIGQEMNHGLCEDPHTLKSTAI